MGTLLRDGYVSKGCEYISMGWVLYYGMDMLVSDVNTLVWDGYINTGWVLYYGMDMLVRDVYTLVRDGYFITGWIC